ncbi:MAG: protein kinase [Chloroflexi bacterium]|nr:protein kinase [Chloroflexota bacterium]
MSQERLGHYRILEKIASGAQGSVYRAFDPDAGLLVALKVLHDTVIGDPSYLERFHREASLASSMDHPNVARIFDVGEEDGRHYIALEYLPENLARLIEGGALPVDRVAKLAVGIADGLAEIHALGIVHRDLKPQNVLITQEGIPKVTDFGIARAESASSMTVTGALMGTPYYMAPEQARGDIADSRSDVYALGCVMYQMLTGELPFEAPTPLAVIRQHIEQEPRPLGHLRKDIPREVIAIVEKAMSKDPDQRYANGGEFALALRQAVPGLRAEPGATYRSTTHPPVEPRIAADTLRLGRRGGVGKLVRRVAIVSAALITAGVVGAIAINVVQNRAPGEGGGPGTPTGRFVGTGPVDERSSQSDPRVVFTERLVETAQPTATPGDFRAPQQIEPGSVVSRVSVGATAIAVAAATATATASEAGPDVINIEKPAPVETPTSALQSEPIISPPPVLITAGTPTPISSSSGSPADSDEFPQWVPQTAFTFDYLASVTIDPASRIHVGGDRGVVYQSGDNGATWQSQQIIESCKFRDIEFVTETRAFALDECGGVLFNSIDGGLTWERTGEINPAFEGVNDIHFIDADTGWAAGPSGFLAVTHNGGRSWEQLAIPTRSYLSAVYFADESRGWVSGLSGGLLLTSDGGQSWQLARTPTDCQINHFAARGSLVWAVGDCDQVIFSADGGATWEDRSIRTGSGTNFTDIEFLDDQTAWISGMQYDPERPVIMETHDGGKTWGLNAGVEELAFGFIEDMSIRVTSDGIVGWAVGSGGLLLKLVSAAEFAEIKSATTPEALRSGAPNGPPRSDLPLTYTWRRLGEFTFDSLYSVAVVNNERVHISGEGGAIYRTQDGGSSFDVADVSSGCSMLDLQFLSSQVGVSADECSGSVIRTLDGGETWNRLDAEPLPDSGATASFFLDAVHGWVAGWNGVLARTENAGRTWEQIEVPTTEGIEVIYFVNEEHGWLAGLQGAILRTRDGGTTWERARTPIIRCRVLDIDAHLPAVWAVDECGGVLVSNDGGETWEERSLDTGQRLEAIAVWDDRTAWAVGGAAFSDSPVILETRDGGESWSEVFSAQDIGGSMEDISVIDGPDGIAGWAVGQSGLIVKLTPTGF